MSLALTFARRELRSGVRGFRVFLACLALGVAALAAAGSTAQAFREGLAAQARGILGGDLAASVEARRFTPAERAMFARLGRSSDTLHVRAMAQGPGARRRLAEVRGVDAAYPLVGAFGLSGATSLRAALANNQGGPGAVVEPALLDRLGLRLGDGFLIGDARFVVRGVITREPDRLGRGFALGPGVIVSAAALERSGLLAADSLFGEIIRTAFTAPHDPAAAIADFKRSFPESDARLRGRNEAAAGLDRLIDQLEYFLGFIGLASLVAGGLGLSTAVAGYLEQRKPGIAVLKALGADAALIRDTYLLQIAALSLLGVAIGLGVGATAPLVLGWAVRDRLSIPALFAVYPGPLLRAAAFGALTAALFSLIPLARARSTPPAALFRRDLTGRVGFGLELAGAGGAAVGLFALTVVTAPTASTALVMIVGLVVSFAALWAAGRAAAALARTVREPTRGAVRIGLANLAGPRSAARTASPAIGLGVALLVTVVLVQSSLVRQIRDVAPTSAPSLIFTQIPGERAAAFDAELTRVLGPLTPDRYRRAPFATGRITALNGRPVDLGRIEPGQRWAFDQDISIAALGPAPPDAQVTAGRWWPVDYAGPPEVAVDERLARGAGLKPGDTLTVSLLGRDLPARVAALRRVNWGGFGTSFALVIDPAAVAGADLRHVAIAKASAAQEARLMSALGRTFPLVNIVSVREQLASAATLFDQLTLAVRGAAAVAGLAGALVLVGAVAAGASTRARETAVLKVLGAGSAQVLGVYTVEYLAVGLIAGGSGAALGSLAAWPIVVLVFKFGWSVDWPALASVLAAVALLCATAGAAAAGLALSARPAATLRDG